MQVPDILLHLVGHVDGFPENHDDDEPAPDADYIVGGTGVVKALSVCLGNKAADYRRPSRDSTPAPSGTATPKQDAENVQGAKGKAMSKNLLGSARKIRARLQPALVREAKQGDDMAYSRFKPWFLPKSINLTTRRTSTIPRLNTGTYNPAFRGRVPRVPSRAPAIILGSGVAGRGKLRIQ